MSAIFTFLEAHECCQCPGFTLIPDSRFGSAGQSHFSCHLSTEWAADWNAYPIETRTGQNKTTSQYEMYAQTSALNTETETLYVASVDWAVSRTQEAWAFTRAETWPNVIASNDGEVVATWAGAGFYSSKSSYKEHHETRNADGIVTWEQTETVNITVSGSYTVPTTGENPDPYGDMVQTGSQVVTTITRTLVDGDWVTDTDTVTTPLDSTTTGSLTAGSASTAIDAYTLHDEEGDTETLPALPSGDIGDWTGADVESQDESTGPPPEDIPAADEEGSIYYVNDPPPTVAWSLTTTLSGTPATASELRAAALAAMEAQPWPTTPEESGIGAALAAREETYAPASQAQIDEYGGAFVLSSVSLRDARYKIRHAIPTRTKNYRVTGELHFVPAAPGPPGTPIPPEPEPGTGTPVDDYVWDKTVPGDYDKAIESTYPISPDFTYITLPELPGYITPALTSNCRPPAPTPP
jgi:hypothetical protein